MAEGPTFKVGDVVATYRALLGWQAAIVRKVYYPIPDVPFYIVSFRNEGGEWSQRTTSILNEARAPDGLVAVDTVPREGAPSEAPWLPDDRRFARLLGEALCEQNAHVYPWGSLGHHLAMQGAWRLAEARFKGAGGG